jgi:hypothetical protein
LPRWKFKVEVKNSTGIEPISEEAEIHAYPNPTSGKVTFRFTSFPDNQNWLKVFDLTGKLIHQSLAESKLHSIDLGGNLAGVYFVRFDSSQKVYKLVLK